MKPSRSTILVLILVGVLTAIQALLGNIVATRLETWLGPWAEYVLPAFLGITGILTGFTVRDQLARDSDAAQRQAARNRRVILEQVWRIWIDGVLQPSLYKATLVPLSLEAQPDAVTLPLDIVLQRPHHVDQPLPHGVQIRQVFDDAGGALLILGAPGAGKTTLLLDLARDLIERAGRDDTHPIPVIFPLTTWAASRHPLDTWLVNELVWRYGVSRTLAQSWIDNDAILPLLDGLDEVAPAARTDCVDAINVFRAARGRLSITVCSRSADYAALTVKLRFHAAIMMQPLSRAHVRQYVRDIGFPVTLSSTSPLWDLLNTPLMLHIATIAYAERPSDVFRTPGSWAEIQDHMLAAYVEQRLAEAPSPSYTPTQTMQYLAWLAWQMQHHNQTVFYLERIQPDWGSQQQQRWVQTLVYTLVMGLAFGLVVGLLAGLAFGVAFGLYLYSEEEITLTERLQWSWSGLVVGLRFGLLGALLVGLLVDPVLGLLVGLFGALLTGLVSALSEVEVEQRTKPNQGIHRSGKSALRVGLGFGLLVGLVIGLLVRLFGGPLSGLFGELGFEPLVGLFGGLDSPLVVGPVSGLAIGLLVGLLYGGKAWLWHYLLRLRLIRQGAIPLCYVRFLDIAARHGLLRKVGGGYIFIHRLLLDYFAKQYSGPETIDVSTVRSVRTRKDQ